MNKNLLHFLLAGAALMLAGCSLPTGTAPGPRVWIDDPLDGAYLPLAPVVVQSHASWEGGTASAALLVNGAQVRQDNPPDASDPLAAFAQPWEPTEAGIYTLQVVATDKGGHAGRSNRVLVHIGAEFVSTVTVESPGQLPILEPPPTFTPTSTFTPTPTFTSLANANLIPNFRFTINANCRQGPGTLYPVVTSFFAGDELPIEGRNEDSSWYWVIIPNSNSHCAVSASTGSPQGPLGGLPLIPAPALPATTVAPPPATTVAPPPSPPSAPGKFSVSDKSCTSSGYIIVLNWTDVSNEDGFRVYRDGKLLATLPANSTSFEEASPDNNPHSYQAEAFNSAGRPAVLSGILLAAFIDMGEELAP